MPNRVKYSAKNLENLSPVFNVIWWEASPCVLDIFDTFLCGSRYRNFPFVFIWRQASPTTRTGRIVIVLQGFLCATGRDGEGPIIIIF